MRETEKALFVRAMTMQTLQVAFFFKRRRVDKKSWMEPEKDKRNEWIVAVHSHSVRLVFFVGMCFDLKSRAFTLFVHSCIRRHFRLIDGVY